MSIWTRISQAISAYKSGESFSVVFDQLLNSPENSVRFTIAIISLSAKMAKADGQVTRDEIRAFRNIFQIDPKDEEHAARVFDLAREDVAGFEEYAEKIYRLFKTKPALLDDVLEGLFQISLADGEYHEKEDLFLSRVAEIFQIDPALYACLRARYMASDKSSPYQILGVTPDMRYEDMKRLYRQLVRDNHPDILQARGLPPEAIQLSETRLRQINHAWDMINAQSPSLAPEIPN